MATGENIFKRKDGRWEARYIKGYDLAGKIIYGFCYGKTYREAKEKVTKCKADILAGQPPQGALNRRVFSWFCDEWLKNSRRQNKPSTYVKYSAILDRHIKPCLGNCTPAQLTAATVGEFARNLSDNQGLAPKSVKDILVVLRSILNYAKKQFSAVFADIEIEYPKDSRKQMRILTQQEQKRFTQYLLTDMDTCKFGVLLALFTGMRIGELCALRWENVSLEEQTIRVTQTMQRIKNLNPTDGAKTTVLVDTPKSDCSVRVIPMTKMTMELCQRMAPSSRTAYLLTGTQKYMEPRALQYRLGRYTEACGLQGVHFHTLRHTFATRCVEVGFEIKTLSEILGHATTTITLERYVHTSLELKRRNMTKLSAVGF